jgi:hypothetical protein
MDGTPSALQHSCMASDPAQASDAASVRTVAGRVVGRLPPHAYFLVSAVFHYLGPAFAVLLFSRIDVLVVLGVALHPER